MFVTTTSVVYVLYPRTNLGNLCEAHILKQ